MDWSNEVKFIISFFLDINIKFVELTFTPYAVTTPSPVPLSEVSKFFILEALLNCFELLFFDKIFLILCDIIISLKTFIILLVQLTSFINLSLNFSKEL